LGYNIGIDVINAEMMMSKELDEQGWKDLLSAVRFNKVDEVAAIIKDMDAEVLSTHYCTRSGATLLYEAARLGNEGVLNLLLDKGVDPNVTTKRGDKPLESVPYAFAQGNTEAIAKYNRMIKRLLEAGAKDEKGEYTSKTDLMCAIQEKNLDKVKELIANGADVNAKDKSGNPVWTYAIRTENKEIMQALIDANVDLEAQNKDGKTALMAAIFNSHNDMAKFLIEKGADVNARSTHKSTKDMTPLFFAKDKEIVEALIKAGADVNAKDAEGETAVWGKSADCLEIMRKAGADLSVKKDNGMTLISAAAFNNDIERVKFLQAQGLDINAKDDSGWTPLMYAAIGKQQAFGEKGLLKTRETSAEFIEQMLAQGAKASITDAEGRTAVDLADERCPEAKKVLEQALVKEKKTLKKDLGLQATVSKSIEDRKVQEAQEYEMPKKMPDKSKQNDGKALPSNEGRG